MTDINMLNKLLPTGIIAVFLLILQTTVAQYPVKIHSHNDYMRTMPFYEAYSQRAYSIEVDMFYCNGTFYVAHDREDIDEQKTFETLYLAPILSLYRINEGKAWADSEHTFQVLIDIKSEDRDRDAFMDSLIDILDRNPAVFDPEVNPNAVRIVISGNRPSEDHFARYPSYILFDGDLEKDYTGEQLERIALFSLNFKSLSRWNGKGSLIRSEKDKVMAAIDKAHALGKPIRFWGAPDGVTAWNTFYSMGVDYINTDEPGTCAAFFHDFRNKTYRIGSGEEDTGDDHAQAKRLDKTTAGFTGFHTGELQLSERVDVYRPTYLNDGKESKLRNVILLIGDGMGLAQICAADAVNRGLSLLNIKTVGLQKTDAEDAYTTDSAAAGSALATGKKNRNRHICMSPEGEIYPSLTDFFYENGYACGVVTAGNLADATPAAFYGHSTERDNSDELTSWLLNGKLTLLTGSGMRVLTHRNDGKDLIRELEVTAEYSIQSEIGNINRTGGKVICVDERLDLPATENSLPLLADATREAILKLSETNPKGFFLMVEGAKIDYAGHANSLPGSVMETLGFDLAVKEALQYADMNGETLVVVTADHETGGLTLVDGDKEKGSITVQYMTDDHTPIMVPVFAYGPYSNRFAGVYPNTDIFEKIKTLPDL